MNVNWNGRKTGIKSKQRFLHTSKRKEKHNRKRMPLGKVKRMEKTFLDLLSKKDNIYLCRRTVGHHILGHKRLVALRKPTFKENGTKPERI